MNATEQINQWIQEHGSERDALVWYKPESHQDQNTVDVAVVSVKT